METYEFYATPKGEVVISESGKLRIYELSDIHFTEKMLSLIREKYTEAFKTLCDTYKESQPNKTYFEFLMVRRFVKCNFSQYDDVVDIDTKENFHFEFVPCPLRGECKSCGIICNPKYTTPLTERENEVMRLVYEGNTASDICEHLGISQLTYNTHKRNVFMKLRVCSLPEFIIYARQNRLFK